MNKTLHAPYWLTTNLTDTLSDKTRVHVLTLHGHGLARSVHCLMLYDLIQVSAITSWYCKHFLTVGLSQLAPEVFLTPHNLSTRRLTDGGTQRTSLSASTQGHQSVQSIQPPRGNVARWGRGVQTTHLFKVLFKHLSSKTFSDSSIRASFQRLDVVFPGNVGGRG